MATAQKTRRVSSPPPPLGWFESWRRRTRNNIRQAVGRGDVTAMIIVWALLFIPILAMHAAGWADGMWSLLVVAFFSVGLGYLLAWSKLSEFFALIVSTTYGVAVVAVMQILVLASGSDIGGRVTNIVTRVNNWVAAVGEGQPTEDDLVFILFMAILFWFLGHNTVWHVFRIDRVWRAILPPGAILMVNNFYYLEDAPLDVYLVLYVFLSLLLITRSHVDAREYEWYRNKVRYPRTMRKYFLRVGAGMAIIFVLIAWILPTGRDQDNLDRFNAFLESISSLSDTWDRLFSSLDSRGVASAEYYGGDRLQLGGAVQLSDEPVFEVSVSQPGAVRYYWQSTIFDAYIGGLWEHNRSVRATKEDGGLQLNIGEFLPGARIEIQQEYRMLLTASSLVYAVPLPVEFGLPIKVELDCVTDPTSYECVNNNLEVDAAITRAIDPVRRGDTYQIISSVSVASADDLRNAATTYPEWISKYLQGTEQVTPRLRQLTQQIIADAGAVNAYDKAKAIERWLRANIAYDESIPAPPEGQDPVDWVVFDYRRGYCNYYASAMIMMLRSEGIPARMAAGFSQGEYDAARGVYLVREREAHTWVQVYFPGYGWVNFEPTADESPLDREGDQTPEEPQATVTPLPSPTPTTPPTNTPVPPGDSAASQPTPTPLQNEQLIPPTSTPTNTPPPPPTFTPTPPPPQQETQVPPEDNFDLLKLFLLLLLIIVAVVVVGAVLIFFTIWWVEHRGLGGLSMVEKAYARLAIYGSWLGIVLPAEHTPEERRRRLVADVPEGKAPISDITSLYVESHFAPPSDRHPEREAAEAWTAARMAFIRRKLKKWFGR